MRDINEFELENKPPKFFGIDIDGTFYVDNEDIYNLNKKSIILLKTKGIIPFFSTSRFFTSAMGVLGDNFIKDTGHNGYPGVYANGCCVFDEHGKMVYLKKFSKEFLNKYIKYIQDNRLEDRTVFITPFDSFFICEPHHSLNDLVNKKRIHKPEMSTLQAVHEKDIVNVIHVDKDNKVLNIDIEKECICHLYGDIVSLTPPGISKVDGIRYLLTHFNSNPSECAYIGDGDNDIEALKYCGLTFVVNNAKNEVKQHANWVVDLTADQGAFAKVVELLYVK